MKNETGIGILDIYDQEDLESCYTSIPKDYKDNIFVVSGTKNKMVNENYRQYGDVPMATLRNWLISQFRIKGLKYFFLLHSNQVVDDPNIFEKTIKMAEVFGTWFLLGDGAKSLPLEDEETKETLYASPELNSEFMFIFSNIINHVGYFDERYFNTKDLDVLDYVIKLRNKNLFPPAHYYATIGDGLKRIKKEIKKTGFFDFPSTERSVGLTYGYFLHNHKYIPGQNDPAGVTQEDLLKFVENLQKNYARSKS